MYDYLGTGHSRLMQVVEMMIGQLDEGFSKAQISQSLKAG